MTGTIYANFQAMKSRQSGIRGRRRPRVAVSSGCRGVRVPRKRIAKLVTLVARCEGVRLAEVDVAVVPAVQIAAINRRYLRHAGSTDVLSFDLSEAPGEGVSAQLVVCGDVAARQARLRGLPTSRELMLYVVHGLLHLMGYEDATARGAAKMHAREEELLREFLG
jgi:probable rRNA maturation factor